MLPAALITRTVASCLVLLIATSRVLLRIPIEEALPTARFPDAYPPTGAARAG